MSIIPVLPLTESDAESYGVLRAAVLDRNCNAMDRLTAAHAGNSGAVPVTKSEAGLEDYPGLVVENWGLNA